MSKFLIKALTLALLVTTIAAAGSVQAEANAKKPASLSIHGEMYPIMTAIVVGSAIGFFAMVFLTIYYFSLEDPSKTNLVYKLSYQRLKTE